ncbi:MAG TPA: NAD(P)-binding domain-containing protein [Vicinamibacterales bacterium]|nr:NAD(P)-binding domain-containing protein [Vicinamibacterales bacterium]
MKTLREVERIQTIVIGAGQAGLSVGYHLSRRGLPFVILDAHARIGDSWRMRWDSLRLFTPAQFDGLDGMPFPADGEAFPTKNEMADYLESYATRFNLPVRHNVSVDAIDREGDRYIVTAGDHRYEAEHVVIAMASYQHPRTPSFASQLDSHITQIHSSAYRNPAQLRPGPVLIVGAGNSGSEIAVELGRAGHKVWMSGRDTGYVPFRLGGLLGRLFLTRFVLRFLFHRVLTIKTPMGRKVRPGVISKGAPLIRVKPVDLEAAHVERVPRTMTVRDGKPELADGRILDVANVIWCTGYHPASSWIHLPIFDAVGEAKHDGGLVAGEPGFYFVGLHFLYAMSSTMIHGVGRDAERIVQVIAARTAEERGPLPLQYPRVAAHVRQ